MHSKSAHSPRGLPAPRHSLHRSAVSPVLQKAEPRRTTRRATITPMVLSVLLREGMSGRLIQPGAVPLSGQDRLNPGGQLQCCTRTHKYTVGCLSKAVKQKVAGKAGLVIPEACCLMGRLQSALLSEAGRQIEGLANSCSAACKQLCSCGSEKQGGQLRAIPLLPSKRSQVN